MASNLSAQMRHQSIIDAEVFLNVTTLVKRIQNSISLAKSSLSDLLKLNAQLEFSNSYAQDISDTEFRLVEIAQNVPFSILAQSGDNAAVYKALPHLEQLFKDSSRLARTISQHVGDLNHKRLML